MEAEEPSTRSNFVTVVAWIFIAFAGFGTFITLLQNIMIQVMFSNMDREKLLQASKSGPHMPAFAQFMISHFPIFFMAMFLVPLAILITAIALLKRKNWARLVFISILALGIVWNLGGIALQHLLFSSQGFAPPHAPDQFKRQAETMFTVISTVSAIIGIGMSVLFAWIIWKLRSQNVVREFQANNSLQPSGAG